MNMGTMTYILRTSLRLIFKDFRVFLLSFSPMAIGILLYVYLGRWLYTDIFPQGKEWIHDSIRAHGLANFLSGAMLVICTIGLFFIIHWTFILVVSLIAAPFNNFLSSRVAAIIKGENLDLAKALPAETGNFSPGPQARWFKRQMQGLGRGIKYVFRTFWVESKKIFLILVVSIIGWSFSLIPFLVPLSFLITMALTAVNFLDYSWGRDDLTVKSCFKDFKKGWVINIVSGGLFLCLLAIPLINVLIIPLAVVYFTILYTLNYQS